MLNLKPDTTPTHLYNPDVDDFKFQLAGDDNIPLTYTLPAQEIITLPKHQADHGAKKLADYLVWKRGIKDNYQLDLENVLKEIYVTI